MNKQAQKTRIKSRLHATSGQIRIIGGQWRGHKLPVLYSPGLRPTTDRIRETLFNWLAPVIQSAHCLDCFAGSGALGFEALSRYAKSAILLEYKYLVAQQLKKKLAYLKGYGEVINTNTLTWLASNAQPFNVVFLDPPFRQGLLTRTIRLLEQQGWLADKARIYLEVEAENLDIPVPTNWKLHREKLAGLVSYRLYVRS